MLFNEAKLVLIFPSSLFSVKSLDFLKHFCLITLTKYRNLHLLTNVVILWVSGSFQNRFTGI